MLTREQILSKEDLPEVDVEVPEWGGTVKVRGFSVARKASLLDGANVPVDRDGKTKLDFEKLQVLSFIEGVVDPKFTIADYELLKNKSARALQRVNDKISEISGITAEQAKNDSGETTKG